jgi:hypothetical protein
MSTSTKDWPGGCLLPLLIGFSGRATGRRGHACPLRQRDAAKERDFDRARCERPNGEGVVGLHGEGTHRDGEGDVTVAGGVGGDDDAGETIVGVGANALELMRFEGSVRGDTDERGVFAGSQFEGFGTAGEGFRQGTNFLCRAAATGLPVSGSESEPTALVATRAPTTIPFGPTRLAVPSPPLRAVSAPRSFATVAPVPAPTLPSATATLRAGRGTVAVVVGGRGHGCPTEVVEDGGRNDRHRPVGGREAGLAFAEPAHHAIGGGETKRAAAGEDDGVALATRFARPRTSVSRVPGAPPRGSTAAAVLVSQRMTVQPVALRLSVKWPTRMPGTSVMALRGPGVQPAISPDGRRHGGR